MTVSFWPHVSADVSVNLNIHQEDNFDISQQKSANGDIKFAIDILQEVPS